jgi:hypothetical protein
VPAVENRRDVDVDDVAVLQHPVARDSVAHDVVDRGAAALVVAAIAERGGDGAARPHFGEHDVVNLLRRHAGHDVRHQRVEDFGGAAAGGAHAGKARRAVELDAPLRPITASSTASYWVMAGYIAEVAPIFEHCRRSGGALWRRARKRPIRPPMTEDRIYTAGLLIIGDEILSGRTQDRNIAQVALWLNLQGIRLAEVRVVPDVMARIVAAVNELRGENDYLFTTGGIGPTHDDITVDAIAEALGVPVVVHPKARAVLEAYYATRGGITAARLRMARVPDGAELIENRFSGAPGIHVENIYILAGVPRIAAMMLDALEGSLEGGGPYCRTRWAAGSRKARWPICSPPPKRPMSAARSAAIPSSATGSRAPIS